MKLSSSDRKALVKLASGLPKGSAERRAVLAGLKKTAYGKLDREAPSGTKGTLTGHQRRGPEKEWKVSAQGAQRMVEAWFQGWEVLGDASDGGGGGQERLERAQLDMAEAQKRLAKVKLEVDSAVRQLASMKVKWEEVSEMYFTFTAEDGTLYSNEGADSWFAGEL